MQKRDSKGMFIRTTNPIFKCLHCEIVQNKRRYNQKYCNSSHQLKYEYSHGLRDKFKTGENARKRIIEKSIERFKTNPKFYISKRGYKQIHIPQRGLMNYHVYVWEQVNGKVPDGMVLHHMDKNKLNNELSNLRLMTKKDHHKLHYAERIIDTLGRLT